MLERMVGRGRAQRGAQPIGQVLRTLPWWRLLLADLVLIVIGGAAAAVASWCRA